MIKKFNLLFLTLFNVGKIKYAPGTFASLATCLLFLFFINYFSISTVFFATVIILLYSIFAINTSFESFQTNDPQEIVIDEVVGQLIPLLAIPIYDTLYPLPTMYYCFGSFILFRFFDIIKPFPISYIDKNTDGPFGIMFDDIVAGFFSTIVLTIILFYFGG
jgi:phosphatidylglycerophosphatase A